MLRPLALVVMLLGTKSCAQTPPVQTQQTNPPAAAAPSAPGAQSNAVNATPAVVKAEPPAAVLGDKNERTIVVESDLYHVEFSNRGGVVKRWKLEKYLDDDKPKQKKLDLVKETTKELGACRLTIA